MPSQYYSPNSKLTGGALFGSFNSKDGAIYLKLLRQVANNSNKIGNFDGKNPLNIKLSQDEAADFVRAVRMNGESKFYHKFNADTSSGTFKYYTIPANGDFPAKSGFGLAVKKNQDGKETEVKVGFTLGSAERFSLFLQNALNHIFEQEHRDDIKQLEEYLKKNGKDKLPPQEEENIKSNDSDLDF